MKATPGKEETRASAVEELTLSRQLQFERLQLGAGDENMETEEAGAAALATASLYHRMPPIPLNLATPPQWKRAAQPTPAFTPSILARGKKVKRIWETKKGNRVWLTKFPSVV